METHQKLLEYQKQITDLQYIINILSWELRTSCPKKSKDYVINLISELELKSFKLETDPKYEKILKDCIDSANFAQLDEAEQRYIRRLLHNYEKNIKIPDDFYQNYSITCSHSTDAWEEAKKSNNYEIFKPHLKSVIEMTKKLYKYQDDFDNLYDAMLDTYEEGITSKLIDKLFDDLKKQIVPLIKKISSYQDVELHYDYTKEELLTCAEYLLNYIGFDMSKGSLGIYPHGFTEKMETNDIRIAFKETTNPIDFVTTIIHEGGHGIFEQSIKENLSQYENVCIGHLYALHESQSRFFENILGRNKNFWIPIYEDISKMLKLDISLDEFVTLLNSVKTGSIRIEADELTYCMHIIIRYEIEKSLFNDEITVDDLPTIWKKKTKEYLNLDIDSDAEGLMQDVHWAEGNFGYFPSYLLGTIYDGMFLESIEKTFGSVDKLLQNGQVQTITEYLKTHIYQYGGAYNSKEIIKKMCNTEISTKPIIKYFKDKYDN